ncbi:MAG: prolipoprotein diacylglyceryl transferase [Eubacterium sp.]|nr:prolipoprotein diacylglyceryl transferase [Eubacterium sp.]
MYNDLFSIGPLTFHTYGLMTAIGIIAAYYTLEYRAKKKGLDFSKAFGLLIWCLVFGYLGSKILYCITILPDLIQDPSLLLRSMTSGWVVYGGILGGMLGGGLFCRRNRLPSWKFFDTALASMALAQGFGRIGCFFAGCCYGREVHNHFSITFRDSSYAPNNVALFPTQLLSSAFDFVLFFFLIYYDNHRKKHDGEPTGLYLTIYSLGRFIIEFWRGDLARGGIGGMSTSQIIAVAVFAVGLVIFIRRRNAKEPVAPQGADAPQEPENTAEAAGLGAERQSPTL